MRIRRRLTSRFARVSFGAVVATALMCVGFVGSASAQAPDGAEGNRAWTNTYRVSEVEWVFWESETCSLGEVARMRLEYTLLSHETVGPNNYAGRGVLVGTFTVTVTDDTNIYDGLVYTGRFVRVDGIAENRVHSATRYASTETITLVGRAEDGSKFNFHEVNHSNHELPLEGDVNRFYQSNCGGDIIRTTEEDE